MGRGQGSGWKNMVSNDSRRHSLASKGIKSAQVIPKGMLVEQKRPIFNVGMMKSPMANAISKEYDDRFDKFLIMVQTEEGLEQALRYEGKTYKKDAKEQLTKFKKNKMQKDFQATLDTLKEIKESKSFSDPLVVTVEWKPSSIGGSNPRSHTNFGFDGSSIGGGGYDKRSTALAEALDSHLPLMKKLIEKKEKLMKTAEGKAVKPDNEFNRKFLGYGSGYSIMPRFEGGVGVNSLRSIIEGLGLKFSDSSSSANVDVYIISR